MKKKILVVAPSFKRVGGVANHYLGLKSHWTNVIRYEFYGKRNYLPAILLFNFDLFKYFFKLIFFRPDVVIINPSLRRYQLFRDGLYLRIADALNIKVITFFHGWDIEKANSLITDPGVFRKTFDKSIFIYVLCEEFKEQLLRMDLKTPVLLTTTKVDNELLTDFDVKSKDGRIKNILFLARIEEKKGIFIALEFFKELQAEFNSLKLTIVGSGSALNKAKNFVQNNKLHNVTFTGPLFQKNLASEFIKGDLYVLPTTHGEGMPTSVLEAMAFGLPIISRPVGGLMDFFEEGKMGHLIESLDPHEYTIAIKNLINNQEKVKDIGIYNHHYSSEHFLANQVANKMESDIEFFID